MSKEFLKNTNVLVIFPHGNALFPHSGCETRTWNLNSSLITNNINLSVLHSLRSKNHEDMELKKKCHVYYYKDLTLFGLSDWYLTDFNPFFIKKLFKVLRKQYFDIIIVICPWGLLTTKLLSKRTTKVIYDSQGIEGEYVDITTTLPNFPKILRPLIKILTKVQEKLACKWADLIVNVSDLDRVFYIKNYKIKKGKTILIQTPSALSCQNLTRSEELKKHSRIKLGLPLDKKIGMFHGGLPHPPNQEAFDLIENYIAPKINDSNILFVFAGHNVKKFNKKNIISLGFVEDLKDLLYAADFAIVPIIRGSGMKIKCTDYIISGLPFISTKKGIQGLEFLNSNEDCLVYDSVNGEFILGIKKLAKDIDLRKKFSQNLLHKSDFIGHRKFENRYIKLILKLINN